MIYKNIVIDGNNLYHTSYNAYINRKFKINNSLLETGGIYGFLKALIKIEENYINNNSRVYILWDNHDSKIKIRTKMDELYLKRSKIDPSYKANRNKEDKTFYRGLDILRSILFCKNDQYIDIQVEDYEADDIVKYLIDTFDPYDKTLIISEDMDWSRNLSNNVHQLMKKKIFNILEFQKKYKFSPIGNNVALYKAIRGDRSDSIPVGIKNLPIELVFNLINDFEDIYELLDNFEKCKYLDSHWKQKIRDNYDRIRLNYQLVDFIPITEKLINENTIKCKRNAKQLERILKGIGIKPFDINEKIAYSNQDLFVFHSKYDRV